ncbi:MAG: DUF2339 domain-containing protein [Victivallaceae bacterium]|nr:DUF2339 domain-containing protein [Victivallaceae bacterium]
MEAIAVIGVLFFLFMLVLPIAILVKLSGLQDELRQTRRDLLFKLESRSKNDSPSDGVKPLPDKLPDFQPDYGSLQAAFENPEPALKSPPVDSPAAEDCRTNQPLPASEVPAEGLRAALTAAKSTCADAVSFPSVSSPTADASMTADTTRREEESGQPPALAPFALKPEPSPSAFKPQPEKPTPSRPAPPPACTEAAPNKFDELGERTRKAMGRIWSWLCVGEEFRSPEVSREYAVATTWLIRIGILILLCGIGFFLKYSIDRNWISPAVRTAAMLLAGTALAAAGVYGARGKYRQLCVALTGAGFATLYLSVMAAQRMYGLISPGWGFGFMCLVTVAAMVVSVKIDGLLPAMIACVAGYLTPLAIPTGSDDPVALFAYMTILGAGTLIASKYRDWILLHLSALVLYAIVGSGASGLVTEINYLPLLAFASANYVLFAIQVLIRNNRKIVSALELFLLVCNIAFYFGFTIPLAFKFDYDAVKLPAMISLFAAAVSCGGLLYAHLRLKAEKYLRVFLLVISAFALAMTVPLLFSGLWITTAWSLMALAFVFAAVKTESRTLLMLGTLVFAITFCREISVGHRYWSSSDYLEELINHLLTCGVYIVSLLLSGLLLLSKKAKKLFPPTATTPETSSVRAWYLGIVYCVIAGLIFFIWSSVELADFAKCFMPRFSPGIVIPWWSAVALTLVLFASRFRLASLLHAGCLVFVLALGYGVFFANPLARFTGYPMELLHHMLINGIYIAALAAAGMVLHRGEKSGRLDGMPTRVAMLAGIFLSAAGILFFLYSSMEIHNALTRALPQFRNGGVSVWWGIMAFAMLLHGIRCNHKVLRITAICLFLVCAAKIFFIDLAHLEQLWRIVSFIAIGVIMLTGAVIYIKFKDKFINADGENGAVK